MSPQRIQRQRTKGWRMPDGAVYVGRPTKWGSPYPVDGYRADYPHHEDFRLRYMATSDFVGMTEGKWPATDENGDDVDYPSREEIRSELAGKDLVCWCPLDRACHAAVLLELANGP